MDKIKVGIFPYGEDSNPYQRLISNALAENGMRPVLVPKNNFFPISKAVNYPIDILQMYWPHSFFTGGSPLNTLVKRMMFRLDILSLHKIPLIFSVENLHPHESKSTQEDIYFTQKIISRCDGIIFMSAKSREIYESVYILPEKAVTSVIPHISYSNYYPNTVNKEESRKKLGIPSDKKVILSLGRINPYKGLGELVKSFLKIKNKDSLLIIAGKAKHQALIDELNQIIENNKSADSGQVQVFNQFIESEDLQYFYNASDIVAVSYTDVPINPGSVVLAMGFGKCIIAPYKGAIGETVPKDGLFAYSDEEPNGLQYAIEKSLTADDIEKKGALNEASIQDKHNSRVVAEKFLDMYKQVLANTRRQ